MTATSLSGLAARGCLPVAISTARNSVVFSPVADATFHESTFAETIRSLGREELYVCAIDAFVEQAALLTPVQPTRLLAHTSACGARLLSNLMSLRADSLVLKEPSFQETAAQQIARASGELERAREVELLRAVLRYLTVAADACARNLVIKLPSWTPLAFVPALAGMSDVRWLAQWRDPVQVVAALMAAPPAWCTNQENRADVRALLNVTDEPSGQVEFCAVVWRELAGVFVGAAETDPTMALRTLDYRELRPDPLGMLLAAEQWLALGERGAPAGFAELLATDAAAAPPRRPALPPADLVAVRHLTRQACAALAAVPQVGGEPVAPASPMHPA
jgi:hypothetical protein